MPYINVNIDISDFDTDDLIEEIERRKYQVMMPGQIDEDIEALHNTKDEIYKLYDAFVAWYQFGVRNETFECQLKRFFEDTIDEKVL